MQQDISDAFAEVWDLIAGDIVVQVKADASQKTLLTIMDDTLQGEGVAIDPDGLRERGLRDLCFHTGYLADQGTSIEVTDYFLIGGERWDFVEFIPIKRAINALGGIQDQVLVRLRLADTLEHSAADAAFTIEEDA